MSSPKNTEAIKLRAEKQKEEEKIHSDFLYNCAYLGICPVCTGKLKHEQQITSRHVIKTSRWRKDIVKQHVITPERIVCSSNPSHDIEDLIDPTSYVYSNFYNPNGQSKETKRRLKIRNNFDG